MITFFDLFIRADLDKRIAEKARLEEERRRANMDKLRKDMEKTQGETVVLSTGLKDGHTSQSMMVDEKEEEGDEEDEDYKLFSEEEYVEDDNDEDEEVAKFSF